MKKTVAKKATEKKLGLIKYEAMETTAMEDEDDDTRYFHLLAKPSKITVTNKATRKIVVKWSRNTTAGGYQVQFSVNKNFSKPRTTVKSTGNKTTTITFKNATKGKTYYVSSYENGMPNPVSTAGKAKRIGETIDVPEAAILLIKTARNELD